MDVPHYTSLASALVSLFGSSVSIAHTDRVSGGDINRSYLLSLSSGDRVFMKANAKENVGFFHAEVAGLSAIQETHTLRTPRPLCTGTDDGEFTGYSFLLMEAVDSAPKRPHYWETFAHSLADMHRFPAGQLVAGGPFGFSMENFIGAGIQRNDAAGKWIPFFRDMRLRPQFSAADRYFDDSLRRDAEKLLGRLDALLVEPEYPSLVHGDLWSGNVLCGSDGNAWLIDPAAYVGNAEADIAMTELFGGFPAEFYGAYKSEHILQDGYEERRDIYNLYHLLNHLNLFGTTYLEPVRSVVSEYVA